MDKVAVGGFHDGSDLEALDRKLFLQWELGTDRQGAVATAQEMALKIAMRSETIDLEKDFWRASHAAQVLWDSGHVDQARALVASWRRLVDVICDERGLDPATPRIWALILSARVEHRARNFGAAVEFVQFAIAETRRIFGGERLAADLRLGAVTPATELYCAALAIAIPAGRMRFGKVPVLRAQFLERWIADAQLLLGADAPPKLLRAHALVIQTFFAIAEREWSEENEAWLRHLIRFDDLLRPSDSRGQQTKPLREEAFARFRGEEEKAGRLREEAIRLLASLPRHLSALKLNGWWPQHGSSDWKA
jgi:hypothetical protein